jgi:hypothetical protein
MFARLIEAHRPRTVRSALSQWLIIAYCQKRNNVGTPVRRRQSCVSPKSRAHSDVDVARRTDKRLVSGKATEIACGTADVGDGEVADRRQDRGWHFFLNSRSQTRAGRLGNRARCAAPLQHSPLEDKDHPAAGDALALYRLCHNQSRQSRKINTNAFSRLFDCANVDQNLGLRGLAQKGLSPPSRSTNAIGSIVSEADLRSS